MATLGGQRALSLNRPTGLFPAMPYGMIPPDFARHDTLRATPRTIGGSIEGGIAKGLNKLGMGERRAAQYGERIMAPLNDVTPVGNVTGAEDGANMFRSGLSRGDLTAMGLGAGAFGLSVIPGAGGKVAKKLGKGMFGNMLRDTSGAIRAWHGSPHDFDRFDMSKIGTGEGAQAYGRGLYFAENPEVARGYRDSLAGQNPMETPQQLAGHFLDLANNDKDRALQIVNERLNGWLKTSPEYRTADGYERFMGAGQAIRSGKANAGPGRLYEVNIDAEPEDFLDWDRMAEDQPDLANRILPNRVGQAGQLYHDFANTLGGFPGDPAGRARAPQELIKRGIPGIRYLDQGSRNAADGTRNYVVFDDSLIDVLNKF